MQGFIPITSKHKKRGNKKQQTCKDEYKHQPLSKNSFEVLNVPEKEGENLEAQVDQLVTTKNNIVPKVPPNSKYEEDLDQELQKHLVVEKFSTKVSLALKDEEVGKVVKKKFKSSSSSPSYSDVLKKHVPSPW